MSETNTESLGMAVIREIAVQDMIKAVPSASPVNPLATRWTFRWAGNAPEQLEAAIITFLRARGYEIMKEVSNTEA